MGGEIEAGRPPGVSPGSQLDAAFSFSVPSLPLPPGRYQWRLDVAERRSRPRSRSSGPPGSPDPNERVLRRGTELAAHG